MDSSTYSGPVTHDLLLDHPHEDALERVLLNHANEEELEFVETHFLACDECITRLEALELFIQATKIAARALPVDQAEDLIRTIPARTNWFGWLKPARLSLVGAGLACALAVAFVAKSVRLDVTVMADRGADTNVVPQWRGLDLHLDARDLPAGSVNVEIVDALGVKIWQGPSSVQSGRLDVKPTPLTTAGPYFIRVLSLVSSAELLREYSIQARPLL